ncbi:MAG TPA: MATE family efflux transporter [Spirochaetia bacterium]|nr:MATE family efflux transporter [Spirochaetia bacterium]
MPGTRDEVTLRRLVAIALPMILSSASETVMLFFNRWFVSFLGSDHIPASMSGGLTQFVFTILFSGIVGYVNALAAQYHGAGRPDRCVQTVSQGVILSIAFYPLLLALIPLVHRGFLLAGHGPRQVALEFAYFRILMAGSLLFLLQSVLAGYFVGMGKTRVVMRASFLGIFVNLPLNWVLVFGKLGVPRMGIEGAALGTLGGSLFIVLVLFVSYLRSGGYRTFGGWQAWRPRRDLLVRLLRYGTPVGVEGFINVFAFNVFVLLMQSYGPTVAAAITITFNWDLVAFIPMLGVGAAVTSMTGQRMGAGDVAGARRAAYLALRLAWIWAGLMVLVFVAGAPLLVTMFAQGFTAGDEQILPLARVLLRLAALYTLADATGVVFSGALRGAGDTKWVLILSGILHWIMAIGAFVFIRILALPPVVVWFFFIAFVMSVATSMYVRHRRGAWEHIRLVEAPAASAAPGA